MANGNQDKNKRLTIRVPVEDAVSIERAAEINEQKVTAWVRQILREAAIKEIYDESDGNTPFPNFPGEDALFRSVLIIVQMLYKEFDVSREDQEKFAEHAREKIEEIKNASQ